MPYAVIDLVDKNRVVMVVDQKWQPLVIEEEWLDEDDEPLLPPTGYPENFYEVSLFENEASQINIALQFGKAVHIDRLGYVDIGEGENREGFYLKEFQMERILLGMILDHMTLSPQQCQESRQRREEQLDEIMNQ